MINLALGFEDVYTNLKNGTKKIYADFCGRG